MVLRPEDVELAFRTGLLAELAALGHGVMGNNRSASAMRASVPCGSGRTAGA